jgi:hypothetical protein
MPRLSLGLGVQAVSKVKSGGAAPSGIPVASTTNLLITFDDSTFPNTYNFVNQAYTKFAYPTAYYYATPNSAAGPALIFDFTGFEGAWSFTSPDGDGGYYLHAYNASPNGEYIPTTGWGGNFTTLTITAA